MTLSDIPEERAKQLVAIPLELATAKKYIQKDLRNYISKITEPYDKVGLDDSIFDFAELVGYRINNKLEDIAEDLDLEERYDLINNQPRTSVCMAFRGHHNKEFMPDYRFNGLFSEEMNDMIGKGKGGRATAETHGDQMRNGGLIGGRKLASMINPETEERYVVEAGRKGNEAQGFHVFSLEEIADIHTFREESIGKGRWKTLPSLDYVRDKMNEKYGENWSTSKVRKAYHNNKDLLPEDENEVKVKNVMERLQTELYNLMSKDLSINILPY